MREVVRGSGVQNGVLQSVVEDLALLEGDTGGVSAVLCAGVHLEDPGCDGLHDLDLHDGVGAEAESVSEGDDVRVWLEEGGMIVAPGDDDVVGEGGCEVKLEEVEVWKGGLDATGDPVAAGGALFLCLDDGVELAAQTRDGLGGGAAEGGMREKREEGGGGGEGSVEEEGEGVVGGVGKKGGYLLPDWGVRVG